MVMEEAANAAEDEEGNAMEICQDTRSWYHVKMNNYWG
jgi:hypothetical protein